MKIINAIKDTFNEALPFQWGMSLFSFGCNLHCKMCEGYNYEKVTDESNIQGEAIEVIDKVISPMHDCVVFIGGEPTIWKDDLENALQYCHDLNLKTKIFSNGTLPEVIKSINDKGLCDAWSIDFKALRNIKEQNGMDDKEYLEKVMTSIKDIQDHKLPLEIRTTFFDGNKEDRKLIKETVFRDFINPYKEQNPELYIRYIEQEDARELLNREESLC